MQVILFLKMSKKRILEANFKRIFSRFSTRLLVQTGEKMVNGFRGNCSQLSFYVEKYPRTKVGVEKRERKKMSEEIKGCPMKVFRAKMQ